MTRRKKKGTNLVRRLGNGIGWLWKAAWKHPRISGLVLLALLFTSIAQEVGWGGLIVILTAAFLFMKGIQYFWRSGKSAFR